MHSHQGIQVRVIEMPTIKPVDSKEILQAAEETGALVIVEEHSRIGGLGGAVAEVVSDLYPVPLKRVGLPDCFAETGPYDILLDQYGMSVTDIVKAICCALEANETLQIRGRTG